MTNVPHSVPQAPQIDLSYNGPAVADGSMDVRDLAPAMLAVGTLYTVASIPSTWSQARRPHSTPSSQWPRSVT